MSVIKVILFDLDNTLIDFMQMKEAACKGAVLAMLKNGLKLNEDEAYQRLMKTYFSLGLESDRAFTEFLKQEKQFNHKILAAAINAYLTTKTEFVHPYPNVKTTLRKLQEKGIILIILTDAPKTKAYQRLLAMNIEKYFNFVVGFEDTHQKKQTGLPLLFVLKRLREIRSDLHLKEILVVGDSVTRDLKPAKELGLKTALAIYGQRDQKQMVVDYKLKDISELLKIVSSSL